jgi:hypothetical protein
VAVTPVDEPDSRQDPEDGDERAAQHPKDDEMAEPQEREEMPTLESIEISRAAALAELEGFAATWTSEGPYSIREPNASSQQHRTKTDAVTMLADGRSWTEDAGGGWSSSDPISGISRFAFVGQQGETNYQELISVPGIVPPAIPMHGLAPTSPLSIDAREEISIEDDRYAGRPAWRVIGRGHSPDFTIETETTALIDIGTGLIVESTFLKTIVDDHRDYSRFSMTDLEVVNAMPARFPGQFPETADVERLNISGGFSPVTLDEAVGRFGPSLVVPVEFTDGRMLALYDHALDNPGSVDPTPEEVRMTSREGFSSTTTRIWKIVPSPITIVVDSQLCYSAEQDASCEPMGATETVTEGALTERSLVVGTGSVTIYGAGVVIKISSVSTDHARRVAESFVVL